jgi:hypothetical protein
MDFLKEVYNHPKFQALQRSNPLAAWRLFDNYKKEWPKALKFFQQERDTLRKANQGMRWQEGMINSTCPSIIYDWFMFTLGHPPAPEEWFNYLKKHKEFWTKEDSFN